MTAPQQSPRLLAADLGFTEGPTRTADGRRLVVSVDRGHVYDVTSSPAALTANVGGGPNGATEGPGGIVYLAQNGRGIDGPTTGAGCVQALHPGGTVVRLAGDLTSPNDLCFGPDGALYVTDPSRPMGVRDGRLWRVDVQCGNADLIAELDWYPNGIGFGPADDWLYVADTDDARIVRFPLVDRPLGAPETVFRLRYGRPDGFAFDLDGNIVVAAAVVDGSGHGQVQTWSAEGELLDVIEPRLGGFCTNVCLEATGALVVTIADHGTVVEYQHPVGGLALHPFR